MHCLMPVVANSRNLERGCNIVEELRVPARWRVEEDEWVTEGRKITSEEGLDRIREAMDSRGSILVEHWIHRGSQAPARLVFDEFEDFVEYLQRDSAGGDAVDVWLVQELCTRENRFEWGKVPDLDGSTPRRGVY